MLSIGYGDPGCGKSSQHKTLCTILPDSIYLCMEYKDIEMLERSQTPYKMIESFNDSFLEDPIATLDKLERTIHDIITTNKYKNIVLDGVSDIRTYAMKEWIYYDNMERKRRGMPVRKTISGENKSAWHEINERVKNLLRPLINWSNVTRNNVFFTAQMKDNYLNDKKIGKAINVGEWCEYDVDVKLEFSHPTLDTFIVKITKLPNWANDNGIYEIEVRKDGLLGLLAERGLIK